MAEDTRPALTARWRALERKGWTFMVDITEHPSKEYVEANPNGSWLNSPRWKEAFVSAHNGDRHYADSCQVPIPEWQEKQMLNNFERAIE